MVRGRTGSIPGWAEPGKAWGTGRGQAQSKDWKEGRLVSLALHPVTQCWVPGKGSSQEMVVDDPVVMPCSPFSCTPTLLSASAFIIAMLLASLNSCCNPWIYLLFTGHLFHELVQRFLCCSSRYLKGTRPGETSVSKKSNSSTFVLSRHSSSQRSCSQPSTV